MHEMSVASAVIAAVRSAAIEHRGHVIKVGLNIGEMAAVNEDSLRFCFEALVKETELEPVSLDITACSLDELRITYIELEEV